MSECPGAEQLEAYAADAGESEDRATIERHLARCDRCRAWVDDARSNAAVLDDVLAAMAADCRDASHRTASGARRAAPPADIPETIGRYHIVRRIDEGGMGVVYEAQQENPSRTVALKVIRPGVTSAAALRRFEFEAQVLGRLHHSGIAQIYEAGAADAGHGPQPFFAMELIDGRTLIEYASARDLGVRERLAILAKVCHAVQHAHQKGVIHRDLKPGNILVDESGQPKVLDFGVARATDADVRATTIQTDIGKLIGTLPYMSPEQVSGDPAALDTRTDVYSLGVVLYELLAGRLPYDVKRRVAPEAARVIRDEEPTPLSSVDRAFRGDVETIVRKALEKDVNRRYQSAAALAADIEHYLRDEPIVARRESRVYVLRKAIRRYRGWVAVGALGVTTLVIAAAAFWVVASQRRTVITSLQEQARQRDARLAAADARNAALTYYYQAVDLIGRGVRHDDALDLLNRALETDPTFSAAYLERGLLRAPDRLFVQRGGQARGHVERLLGALRDFDHAHEFTGGDWLVDPRSGRRLTPAEARAAPANPDGRLREFPDVLRLDDGSLVRIEADGRRTPVGGPGLPRALVSAANLLAARLRQNPSAYALDAILAKRMDRYYQRAAALDPADVYTHLSKALAAAVKPTEQAEAARLLGALTDNAEATALVEYWQALAEVRLGGPRRRFPEAHPQRDPAAAERAARRVTELAPRDVYGWYVLALALQEQGRYADAIRMNERALVVRDEQPSHTGGAGFASTPGWADVFGGPILTNLATCHALLGDFDAAWPLYEQALEASGGSLLVLLERAEAYRRARMSRQAEDDLHSARDTLFKPVQPLPALALPVSWALLTFPDPELRDPDAARRILIALRNRELYQDDRTRLTLLSYAHAQCGEPRKALEIISQLPASSSARPFTDAVKASILQSLGQREQARELFRKARDAAQRLTCPDARLTRLLEQVQQQAPPQ